MSPEQLKALRSELGCTAKELGLALGLDQKTVLAWEKGELFPTKRYVTAMEKLRKEGKGSVPKVRRGKAQTPLQLLADPQIWALVRKLLVHPTLRAKVMKLAKDFDDPEGK